MGLFSKKNEGIYSPIDGEIKPLKKLNDGVFSEKMMGDGIVVQFDENQTKGKIYAPISGKLITVFPTGHAYGIKNKAGLEILVHIGLETVSLKGEGFTIHVKQNKNIKAGALMATVDLAKIRNKVPAVDPIIIVTSGQKLKNIAKGKVTTKDSIFIAE